MGYRECHGREGRENHPLGEDEFERLIGKVTEAGKIPDCLRKVIANSLEATTGSQVYNLDRQD